MTAGLHKLGDVLRSAREAKGVELGRVERDTKIRARYLAALESGEYRELPGAVYTKGFLRNYGLYLGLDPEYLIDLYRLESGATRSERRSLPAPPRPLAARRSRAFVVTPGAVVAALLTVLVAALVYYFVREFVTFAGTPDLRISEPAGDVAAYHDREYTIRGVTAPNSRVVVTNADRQSPQGLADGQGNFAITVKLFPGSNLITIVASDPVTKRDSESISRTINVVNAVPSASPGPQLAVDRPADRARVSGPLKVSGRGAAGSKLALTAKLVSAAKPTFIVTDANGRPVKLPAAAQASPRQGTVQVAADGTFSATMSLAPGTWDVTIAAQGGARAPVVRRVTVASAAGLAGVLAIGGGPSYLEIYQDGKPKAGVSGGISQPGQRISLAAKSALRIRAGNAGAVDLTINGLHIGPMGASGAVVEWRVTLNP